MTNPKRDTIADLIEKWIYFIETATPTIDETRHIYIAKLFIQDLQSLTQKTTVPKDGEGISKKCPGCGVEGVGCICSILNPVS